MKIKVVFVKDCKWGHRWEIKEVAPALFNNVLSKQWVAVKYWSAEANNILNKIKKQEEKHEKEIQIFQDLLNKLATNWLTIEKKLTPGWHFYDKVDSKEISNAILRQYWIKIPHDKIKLKEKINQPGQYEIEIWGHWLKKKIKIVIKGK